MPERHVTARNAFIGRREQLATLTGLLGAARDHAVAVLVSGETGVGKSRLLAEFADRARAGGAVVLRGACVNLAGGAMPYAPLVEALRRLAREVGEERAERLGGTAYSELKNLLSGAVPAAAGSPALVFGAVLRLLENLGRESVAVLLVEDLHWADTSTVDLLMYVTRAMTDERVLVACTLREAVQWKQPLTTLVNEGGFDRLELSRFTRDELRQYVESVTAGPAERAMLDRLAELSDGNVFVAAELLRAGVPLEPVGNMPARLRGHMLARVEEVTPPAGEVLKVAAVAGPKARHSLLLAVCGLDRAALNRALHECVDHYLLTVDRIEDAYAFWHGALREAVHGTLFPDEIKELHRLVAAAMEVDHRRSIAGNEMGHGEVAHHWLLAENPDRAVPAFVRAGDAERAARAFPEATIHYEKALAQWDAVTTDLGRTHDEVLAAAADAARWAGDVPRAIEWIGEAIRGTGVARPRARAGELYERLGSYLYENNDSAASRRAFEDAIRALDGVPLTEAAVRSRVGLSLAHSRAGRYEEARRMAEQAVDAAESLGDDAVMGRARNALGVALTMLGRGREGVVECRSALALARTTGAIEDVYRAYGNLSLMLLHSGELAHAVAIAREGWTEMRDLKLGQTRQAGVIGNNLAVALGLWGEWDEAATIIGEIVATQPPVVTRFPRLTLAEIEVARGRFDDADRLLRELDDAGRPNDPRFRNAFFACTAELALWRGDTAAVTEALSAGIAAAQTRTEPVSMLGLCAVGLRAAAEESATPGTGVGIALAGHAGALMGFVRLGAQTGEHSPELSALVTLCELERDRITATATADGWAALAETWHALRRPYPEAYARFQEALAARPYDPTRSVSALGAAEEIAGQIGADPLRDRIRRDAVDATVELPRASPRRRRGDDDVPLTPRESDVLREMIRTDATYRQIARALGISEKTIGAHAQNMYRKLGTTNRAGAVLIAMQRGLG
jgi:DNA-binding CsgD family transcriptional regulator/Flp pilus assembly protein TadD